jgi:hypothetical protein
MMLFAGSLFCPAKMSDRSASVTLSAGFGYGLTFNKLS